MGVMKEEKMCMYVRQVLNGVSNGTQGMFMYLCFNVCACLYAWVFLLMCTLHPWAMVAPFLIRAIIIGLSPGSTSWSLTPVKICQVNFFRICCDNRILRTSRQQALKFLKGRNWLLLNTKLHHNHLSRLEFKMCKSECLTTATHIQFFRANPVVFRELDVKLEVKVSLLKWVSVLRHSLSLHHSNRAWRTDTHRQTEQQKGVKACRHNKDLVIHFVALASATFKLCNV